MGYSNGYVTVDNYDWYINQLYLQYKSSGKKINSENMKELYIDLLWENIQFYDKLAKDILGRSPKHVLLLHENEIAALYLGNLIDRVRSKGWKIISPVEAYQDPLAGVNHDLPFSKQGRVASVAHYNGVDEKLLRHKNENVDYIKKIFEDYNIVEN
ncbi:hypothetical protein [Microbulbifer rhizosphaerae]|uniref:Uncharacterized protein n=1 Tax=Microbulbifer rhizosphaerae TaxID=1562603 RepID=A0A7W4ZBK3_9GAMM|nr:hypothetical protein [Microbulbifer rhizosphaerae]MBB3063701.1 hypothetical protein [Microbulbifer rhizosphaerae]